MRSIFTLLILAVHTTIAPLLYPVSAAEEPKSSPVSEARQLWLRGNYEEARAAYEKLRDDHPVPAAIGIARTWQSVGSLDKALAALDDDAVKQQPDGAALRAELLFERGRWDEAQQAIDAALKAKPDHFLARWIQAQLWRDSGELKKADDAMRWFVRTYTQRSFADNDITDADELILIGQAGSENARWHRLSDQFRFILNEIYADALKDDPNQWRAEYLAGLMLLEKYNQPDAMAAFDTALKINPRAAEVLVAKGMSGLQRLEVSEARRFADEALEINPNLVPALRLLADVYLHAGEIEECVSVLERARRVNPRDEPTLGRLGACLLMRRDQEAFDMLVKEVKAFDSSPGIFYFELAESLSDKRLYTAAEEYYVLAIQQRSNLLGPRGSLGMLYMRLGDEEKARDVLKEAFKVDPFNIRVANSLKVLRHLEGYATLATEHFDIRYDPKTDAVLAQFLAEDLETYHAMLKDQFQFAPEFRILVEVFNRHEMFSGRTVALPDLHTIGACTGKVITMVSPSGQGVREPFNWGRVIRHELTHVFNLAQTDFRVPHWLTEGLAVRSEGYTRPRAWSALLARRLKSGEILDLETILLGFVRPRSHEEWTLAYCQSELYVDYLTRTYGPDVIAKLLNTFREGVTTKEAIRQVCGIELEAFEAAYRDYLKDVVRPFEDSEAGEALLTLDELVAAVKNDPDDVNLKARLAYQFLRRRRVGDARDLVDTVLRKQEDHPLGNLVRARILITEDESEKARERLIATLKKHPDDARLLREMARLHETDGELSEAIALLEHGRRVAPDAEGWLMHLIRLYARVERNEELAEVLTALANEDADDLRTRARLAPLLIELEKFDRAEEMALDALRIDIGHVEARATLLKALESQGRSEEATTWRQRFQQ